MNKLCEKCWEKEAVKGGKRCQECLEKLAELCGSLTTSENKGV